MRISDWSSDVCSSDLLRPGAGENGRGVGADGEETGDAGVEQAGQAPLDIEAERQDGEDADEDRHEHRVVQQAEPFHRADSFNGRPLASPSETDRKSVL